VRAQLDRLCTEEAALRHALADKDNELSATAHDLRKMIHENQVGARIWPAWRAQA